MADYKKMYQHLFNSVTDAIAILEEAQKECERLYIEAQEETVELRVEEGDGTRKMEAE